jgi:hypothetical protein
LNERKGPFRLLRPSFRLLRRPFVEQSPFRSLHKSLRPPWALVNPEFENQNLKPLSQSAGWALLLAAKGFRLIDQFAWPWAWLFPAHHICRHPRTGQLVRYRMHEAHVQNAIRQARRQLGIMVLPHELRHAYATHCLERGTNPRAIQEAMGHANLETTMERGHPLGH